MKSNDTTIIINPTTEEQIAIYNRITVNEAKDKVAQAKKTFNSWKQTSFKERANLMHSLADILLKNTETYSKLATQEMGKTIMMLARK